MMLTPGGRLIVFIIFSNTLDLSDTADTWLEEIPLHIKKKEHGTILYVGPPI